MLWIEPHAGPAPILSFIAQAQTTLDINDYLVTDRTVIRAIAQAVRRGVRVRVLIDRKPYGGRPAHERARLQATGAQVRFAPPRFTGRYRFDHAKYMVSGSAVEIGSANLTYAAFRKNREYLWTATQPVVAQALRTVFRADWRDRPAGPFPRQALILSPGATPMIAGIIDQPGPVCMESEEIGRDRPILAALRRKGSGVTLVLPAKIKARVRPLTRSLARAGVHIRWLRQPYLHAKLIGGPTRAFIGSQNLSWTSLNRNREVGVLLGARDALRLYQQCQRDAGRERPIF